MSKRGTILVVAAAFVTAIVAPAHAWVAARGYHGAVAVGGNRCCYSGGAVAGAAVVGMAVGAAAASAARPPAVVYAPPPVVYVASPPIVVGMVVYALPAGCGSVVVNGVQYFNCGGGFYKPVYQGGAVTYLVVPGP